ncbi:zinc finger protein ZOP1 isoform X2 [Nymphaea colorata]|uniref:zinc finger protein ZOP1 isoform X2 n=1 Tax=Nymphaea colorata TaxID=210225 RepID=UPI00129D449A|nr:zinc finger protein ZOP1 isoform X2 [Nymphaea colorata]
MTEYWVSQGNKWCDFCKIYIANNPLSIRTHELGQRHKDNVAKRLSAMRKENAAKEKEKKDAERALEHIEAKAKQSYQKDLASFQGARRETELKTAPPGDGKWMTQEEASTLNNAPRSDCAGATCSKAKDGCERIAFSAVKTLVTYSETEHSQSQGSPAPRPVLKSAACARSIKGVPSSIAVTKRKRDEKPKAVSEEEAAALKARDAARKRVEEREKSLLGLYRSY